LETEGEEELQYVKQECRPIFSVKLTRGSAAQSHKLHMYCTFVLLVNRQFVRTHSRFKSAWCSPSIHIFVQEESLRVSNI